MFRNRKFVAVVALLSLAGVACAGPITISVFGSLGPNIGGGGSSYPGYSGNALTGIQAGGALTGGAGRTQYSTTTGILPWDPIVSTFPSWRGTNDPAGPDLGSALFFGVHIVGDGTTQFSLSQLTYDETNPISGNGGYAYSADTYGTYGGDMVGINWGANRAPGGGDDTVITTGAASQTIDELIYVGEKLAYEPNPYTGSNQADLNGVASFLGGYVGSHIIGKYTITQTPDDAIARDTVVFGSADVEIVPEPGTIGLAFLGLAGLLALRRWR